MSARHPIIAVTGSSGAGTSTVKTTFEWIFRREKIDAAIVACQRGLGYGQFFDYQVQETLRGGKLKPVLEPHWPTPTPIHVVYPQARLLSGNVRSFVDFVVPRLRSRIAALRG